MSEQNIIVSIVNDRTDDQFEVELPMEPKKLVEKLNEHGIGLDADDAVSEDEMESCNPSQWSIHAIVEAPEAIKETFENETDLSVINDLAALYFDAEEKNLEALELYKDELYTPSSEQLLNLLKMDVRELEYHSFAHGDGDDSAEKRFGMEIFYESELAGEFEERGLIDYFDFESYGEDKAVNAYLGNDGYFWEEPDLDEYDLNDLHGLAEDAGYDRYYGSSYSLTDIADQARSAGHEQERSEVCAGRDER